MVMATSVKAVTSSVVPNLRDTTTISPPNPKTRPSHWRCVTFSVTFPPDDRFDDMLDTQIAVNTGCNPTISAASPEPIPPLMATHTPPK